MLHLQRIKVVVTSPNALSLVIRRVTKHIVLVKSKNVLSWLSNQLASRRIIVFVIHSRSCCEAADYSVANYAGMLIKITIYCWCRFGVSYACRKLTTKHIALRTSKRKSNRIWKVLILILHSENILTKALLS